MRTIDSTPPLLTLRSLFWLRHCAVLAQLLSMMVAHHWLAYPIPWPSITSILLLTAAFNFYTGWWLKQATPFRGWRLYLQFGFDVLQLAAVLYYTGAAQNPFVSLLLLPIALALLTGNIRLTVSVLALAVLAYLFLLFWPPAFHWHINHDEMMQLHLYGMWINFVVTAIAMAGFGLRLLQQMRLHEQEVRQARERALRDERLVALGTQAAQVAHQLGTPLNTLMLLADELKQPLSAEERQQVLTELDRQIAQARNWLLSLRNIGEQEAVAPIGPLIRDTLEQWRWYRPQAELETKLDVLDELAQPVPSSLAPALLNLFNNAYEASQRNGQHRIAVHATRDGGQLLLSIEDAGSGFVGEPFGDKAGVGKRTEGKTSGLGIGIHLANASIERLGGEVSWQALPQGGTRTDIRLPLELP